MWPLTIAFGVYIVCKGIQESIDYNRDRDALPPPDYDALELDEGTDLRSLSGRDYPVPRRRRYDD